VFDAHTTAAETILRKEQAEKAAKPEEEIGGTLTNTPHKAQGQVGVLLRQGFVMRRTDSADAGGSVAV
jgi:hypothetical protein